MKPLIEGKKKRKVPYFVYIIIGVVLMVLIFLTSMVSGQFSISFADSIRALFGSPANNTYRVVIWELRVPRTLVALLVGVALSIAGLIFQSTFQNELVSPDIIGVSSGASVGVALAIILGLPLMLISGIGFVFGALAMVLTLLITKVFKNKSPIMLVIAGILVAGLMSSIVSLMQAFSHADRTLPTIVFWLLGSFSRANMTHFWILLPIVTVSCVFLFLISSKILDNVALGREEAKSKGINYKVWRIVIIGIGTILTAASVAVAGTIGWVGLVIPHIVRLMVGYTSRKTMPIAILFGGSFMMVADILSRTLTGAEIPVGAIVGILGIIAFLGLLATKKGAKYNVD